MKIPRIFGVVVFLHVLVITIVLVQPGCRTKNSPAPVGTADSTPATTPDDALDPVLANEFNPVSGPATSAPGAAGSGSFGGRQPPTRPTVQIAPGGRPVASPATTPVAPAATHTVARGDSLWKIAQRYSVTVGELMEANNLNRSSTIQPGQQLVIPARASDGTAAPVLAPVPATVAAPAPAAAAPAATYTVRGGDTLSAIAARHGTTVAALRQANRLTNDVIRAGQVLTLPGPGGNAPTPPAPSAAEPEVMGGATHTVAPGETPGAIARRYGVSVEALLRANNIDDPRRMRAGQVLMIPGGTAPAPIARPVTSSPAFTPPSSRPAGTPLTPAELEAQLGNMSDADLLPVEDAPLTPVPPPRR